MNQLKQIVFESMAFLGSEKIANKITDHPIKKVIIWDVGDKLLKHSFETLDTPEQGISLDDYLKRKQIQHQKFLDRYEGENAQTLQRVR